MLNRKLAAVQANVQRHWDPHFAWVIHETAPWAPLARPLAQCTVALVTTCGLYRADTQLPFAAWHHLGDPSFREIHLDTPTDRLRIAHARYDHRHVAADLNVAVPIAHFNALVAEGVVGRLYPWIYSFMGYVTQTRQLVNETAPTVARRLKADGVDAAFLTPC
ncbi:MAG: glycine/betaine/sarcosine/D-proline family reductase selenoprotein B [Anaerolineae bacterium]|nr:glycine/betaine/sarcosine/D-proline family reductase selenoprotein B [Anaerolineae bacterium]